ncbi:ABC transporter permease [Bacteroidota bacterium]
MFDLEQSIKKWKKSLRKNPSLEDGYIEELESHLRDLIDNGIKKRLSNERAFDNAVKSLGDSDILGNEYYKTDSTEIINRRNKNGTSILSLVLLYNYFKIAFRYIRKYKGYSFLNILGLAIGVTCCLLILLYVQFELSYDTYHISSERIYRVCKSSKTPIKTDLFAPNVTEVAPTLLERFPEVEAAGIAGSVGEKITKYEDKMYIEKKVKFSNSGIFDILNTRFLRGEKQTALTKPFTIVITEHIADRYFTNEDPIGKILMLDTTAYEVTHVIEDCPLNTHLKYDMFAYLQEDNFGPWHEPWWGWHGMNYIRLAPGVDPNEFEARIKYLPHEYIDEKLKNMGVEFTLFFQPITDIHLYSNFKWEAEPPGNPGYVYVFIIVGILIILITCMNFINLATARSASRANEVGMRKVIGAYRFQILFQFLGESILLTLISVLIALVLSYFLLPVFNNIAGTNFNFSDLISKKILVGLSAIIIFIGIAGGMYPAIILSAFKPVSILKGLADSGKKGVLLRKVLVVSQFAISIILIIGTILFYQQIDFMKNTNLGFDKEQKLVLEFNRSRIERNSSESIKVEFLNHPLISEAAFSSSVPGRWMYLWRMYPYGEMDTKTRVINVFQVDFDFFDLYNIEIAEGRKFDQTKGIDQNRDAWILNEAAVKAFEWKSNAEALEHQINRESNQIVGVMKDFHFRGLQNTIDPLMLYIMADDFRYLTLEVSIDNLSETMDFVENKYKALFPEDLYQFFFLNEDFNKQYISDERIIKVFGIFTFWGIFIACLGLFGLAAFTAEKRTKEIGIRKTMGASLRHILIMLTGEFIKYVLIANFIAWPIAYFGMNFWLDDFAYRINISLYVFIIGGLIALLVTLLTVIYQTLKAALANPVDSLKYE